MLFCAGIMLAALNSLSAATIYSETFDTDPGYVIAKGPDANNISSIAYGVAGAGSPSVAPGQYAGTSQYLSDAAIPGSTASGAFAIGSNVRIYDKSRNRCYVTFIDTSSAAVGYYNVSFDVSEFQSTDANTALYFHLFEGGGTDKGHVTLQVTHQRMLPEQVPTLPTIKTGKGATFGRIAVDRAIQGNGKFNLDFNLSQAGKPGDYLALVWSQVKQDGNAVIPSMTIDNVTVSRLGTQPATVASAQAAPTAPQGRPGVWDLQRDFSDEFNVTIVDPQKWANKSASWGPWTWDENNAYQENGKLVLRMVHESHTRNGKKLFYKSGIVRSNNQRTYGYYEARIKGCSLFPGACPAFWVYSDGKQSTGEVRYCEIDFVELQMNELDRQTKVRNPVNHIDMNLHLRLADKDGKVSWVRPMINPELCANSWLAPWDPRADFHVYGTDVTPEMIVWYIDGKEVARKPNKYWHLPMNLTLSLGLRHPHIGWVGQEMKPVPQAATAAGFPTSMEVDYVRVWERK